MSGIPLRGAQAGGCSGGVAGEDQSRLPPHPKRGAPAPPSKPPAIPSASVPGLARPKARQPSSPRAVGFPSRERKSRGSRVPPLQPNAFPGVLKGFLPSPSPDRPQPQHTALQPSPSGGERRLRANKRKPERVQPSGRGGGSGSGSYGTLHSRLRPTRKPAGHHPDLGWGPPEQAGTSGILVPRKVNLEEEGHESQVLRPRAHSLGCRSAAPGAHTLSSTLARSPRPSQSPRRGAPPPAPSSGNT